MPTGSESDTCFTRSQIAIVKEAEALILSGLSRRITAKELADRFGVSESSFKFYVNIGRQLPESLAEVCGVSPLESLWPSK